MTESSQIPERESTRSLTQGTTRSWPKQLALVSTTFTLLGVCISLVVFWNASQVLSGSIISGLAAGMGGGLSWMLFCGRQSRPAWWRTILAGVLAGVMLHPIYLLLSSVLAGQRLAVSDFFFGSMFFLLVAGVITVPSGIVAAVVCRAVGVRNHPADGGRSQPAGELESRP